VTHLFYRILTRIVALAGVVALTLTMTNGAQALASTSPSQASVKYPGVIWHGSVKYPGATAIEYGVRYPDIKWEGSIKYPGVKWQGSVRYPSTKYHTSVRYPEIRWHGSIKYPGATAIEYGVRYPDITFPHITF
jgi:hypothetical protein